MDIRTRLSLVAFGSGAAVMIFEITASRAIAPYLGSSLITWTSLIGVVLASLSIGNWLGGRVADSTKDARALCYALLMGAALLAITNLLKSPLLDALAVLDIDLRIRTVIAAITLLTPTSIILGMVGPFIGRQLLTGVTEGGRTIGLVSALGNIGSIVGTFLAGFVLLPGLGTSTVLSSLTVMLVCLALLVWIPPKQKLLALVLLATLPVPSSLWWKAELVEAGFIDADTAYSRVWIQTFASTPFPVQQFQIDRQSSSARFIGSSELVFDYNRALRITDLFRDPPSQALLIGGAGYTFSADFLSRHPSATLDVVEIDPGVTELARKHFGLVDTPRQTIIHEDGRTFINTNTRRYDVIFIDAYNNQFSIPFQLITKEAVAKLRTSLTENGIIAANIIGTARGDKAQLVNTITSTFATSFKDVYLIPTYPKDLSSLQNFVLLASNSSLTPVLDPRTEEEEVFLSHLFPADRTAQPFTDDFAPVERLLDYSL